MEHGKRVPLILTTAALMVGCSFLCLRTAWAHCDTMGGPVVADARIALEKGDITPILKWVKKENEAELRAAFSGTLAVRGKGPEARQLADRYFLETVVRLHRFGEGAPYTGIKDEPVEPIVALADKALADGSADEMTREISAHMAAAIGERLKRVVDAARKKDTSVEAGRDYVEAYVTYMHFVEGIHAAIEVAGDHLHAEAAKAR
jgi:hypothetical protein